MTTTAHVMVVSPHPDDAEYGTAGTVARWTREGKRVIYVVCTSGEKGTGDILMRPERLADIREKEQSDAAKILGVSEVIFLRLPDLGLEDTPEFRKQIVRLIRLYQPELVVTADPYRRYLWHRDHRIAGQVTLDAAFSYARNRLAYPDLLEEDLQPHKVQEMMFWSSENVNYRSDITDTYDLKIAALHCHQSQLQGFDVPRLEDMLNQRCIDMAKGEDFQLAEGFHRVEILW